MEVKPAENPNFFPDLWETTALVIGEDPEMLLFDLSSVEKI